MANINLLPDDFRQREQKEIKKASRISKDARVEFSSGQKASKIGADQDKPSFWTRLFGTGGSKQAKAHRPVATPEKYEVAPKKELHKASAPHQEQSKAVYQPRTTRWADILGTGVVKPDLHATDHGFKKEYEASKAHQPIVDKKDVAELAKSDHQKKNPRPADQMGWWEIIRSIFVPGTKKEPELRVNETHPHHEQKKHDKAPVKQHPQKSNPDKRDKSLHDAPKTSKLLIDVNLIPQELLLKKHWSPASQIIFILIATLLPALLVAGVYFGIAQLQQATDRDIAFEEQRMDRITTAVAALHKRQATDRYLERKLVAMNGLMKHHIRWSSFFAKLEKYTLDAVYYTDIKADISGELVLPAVAPSYEVAAQQLVALREADDFVSDAQVNSMQILTDSKKGVIGVSFNLKIVLKDDVLLAP